MLSAIARSVALLVSGGCLLAARPMLARAADSVDLQASLTLDRSLVQFAMFSDGKSPSSEAGQTASEISFNNFINYCGLRPEMPLTNGQQLPDASCSSTPQGHIAPATHMPHAKFVFPFNTAVLPPNTPFTLRLAVRNFETGHFANPDVSYYAAPQEIDASSGLIRGHSHVVIQRIPSLASTQPVDPQDFVFFKGMNAQADGNGELSATVSDGLQEGTYRLACINAATNHQPLLVAVAQRGTLDDMVYFEVKAGVAMPSSP